MPDQKEDPQSGAGFLVRLYWLFIGNVLLFFLLVFIFEKRPPLLSRLDVTYLVAVASLIVARYIDIRFLNGRTGEDKPATMTDLGQYMMIIGPAGVGAWLLVRVLIHFLK